MATILVDHTSVELALTVSDRLLAARREPVRLARTTITKVQLVDDAWSWIRGVRAPGTALPGVLALGTWRTSTATDFVLVRGRGRPGVVIDLDESAEFDRVLLTTRHGLALVRALGADSTDGVIEVGDS